MRYRRRLGVIWQLLVLSSWVLRYSMWGPSHKERQCFVPRHALRSTVRPTNFAYTSCWDRHFQFGLNINTFHFKMWKSEKIYIRRKKTSFVFFLCGKTKFFWSFTALSYRYLQEQLMTDYWTLSWSTSKRCINDRKLHFKTKWIC